VLSNGHVTFHWHKVPHVKTYVVHISNLGEETIFQKEVSDTTATLDFSKINFGKSKMCLWSVTAKTKHDKEHKSEKHGLQLIPAAKAAEITKEVASLTADSDPKSSLGKIMMAAYYEDHNMYVDALHEYEEALKIEHNKDYQDMYHNFLYRAGLAEHPAK
jgi:predicted Zn-dependent protease